MYVKFEEDARTYAPDEHNIYIHISFEIHI